MANSHPADHRSVKFERHWIMRAHRRTNVRRSPVALRTGAAINLSAQAFLADVGMGFTGLVLGKMLADDGDRAGE